LWGFFNAIWYALCTLSLYDEKDVIRQNSWLARLVAKRLGFLRVAVVIGRNIYLHNATVQEFMKNKRWLLHELKHVEQYEIGLLRFFKEYFREYRKNGYDNNRFEIEARQAEEDTKLLEKYDLSLYMML
jgi:hypothetical protein